MFGTEVESMLGLVVIDVVVVGCDVVSEIIVLFVESEAALTDPTISDTAKNNSIKVVNPLNSCFLIYSPTLFLLNLLCKIYNLFTISIRIIFNCT
jgi:hypothetical protein